MAQYICPGIPDSKWDDFFSKDEDKPSVSIHTTWEDDEFNIHNVKEMKCIEDNENNWWDIYIDEECVSTDIAETILEIITGEKCSIKYNGTFIAV